MKFKFLVASAAIAATMLTACQNDVDFTQEDMQNAATKVDDNAIQFGTYLSGNQQTRAGEAHAIGTDTLKGFLKVAGTPTWSEANAKKFGFGVFAYYTGTKTYGQYQDNIYTDLATTTDNQAANFMFNQQVWWNNPLDDSYITKWTYSPIKYWPNEVQGVSYTYTWKNVTSTATDAEKSGAAAVAAEPTPSTSGTLNAIVCYNTTTYYKLTNIEVVANTGVDDQDNDKNNNNAYTDYSQGGNVSFFAYAPYVDFGSTAPQGLAAAGGTVSGIVAINKQTILANANGATGDPILTYILPADAKKVVDLLWGTKGNTSSNVKNTDGGVTSTVVKDEAGRDVLTSLAANTDVYAKNILRGYATNADLSKQKTTGTIDFLFKHATSKVGGATTTSATAGDPSSIKNGLMVVLDLDDMKGAEVGGAKEDATKVTVKEIKIEARTLVEDGSGNKPGDPSYTTSQYLKSAQGDFNLATGKWDVYLGDARANIETTQSQITPTTYIINQSGTGENVAGELNDKIEEPTTALTSSNCDTELFNKAGKPGVLTTAQNVYKDGAEAYPLVFIPGTYPELTVTVDYFVRTKDANLSKTYSEVEQKITKKLTFTSPVELNKQYSLLIHLGLTSVKFTASVSDWDVYSKDGGNNFDSDGDGVDDIKVEDVWTPRNVGGMIVAYPIVASNTTSQPVSVNTPVMPYYYENDEVKLINSGIGYETKPSWITAVNSSNGTLTIEEYTDYSPRTGTIQLKYVNDAVTILSEPIEITQLGRIPTSVDPNWGTDPALATAKEADGGDVISYTVTDSKVKVSGKESDNSPFTNEEVTIDISDDDKAAATFIFIDKATGNKATWITVEDDKFVVAANPSTASRQADLYVLVKGKLVPVITNGTLTQKGKS